MKITGAVLRWYARHRRPMPWRTTRNPYRILIAEIMLQQTGTDRVAGKWGTFLRRFPTIRTLARGPVADVIREWSGLGYNNRAVRLHRCSVLLLERYGGRLPSSPDSLMELPGIGRYTAHAIACFAFGKRVPVVDVNTLRIFSRLFPPSKNGAAVLPQKKAWKIASELLPLRRYYEWNQALMDIGATICTAASPRCGSCPLVRFCPSAHGKFSRPGKSRKSEPLCAGVPRRFVRGAIVQDLRIRGRRGWVGIESVLGHLKEIYPRLRRAPLVRLVVQLEADGLLRVRRKNTSAILVSLP